MELITGRRNFVYLFFVALVVALSGCHPGVRTRPVGYLRVGKIMEIPMGVSYRPDLLLVVRRDIDGVSAMSTACTYDLSPLALIEEGGSKKFRSSYSASSYSLDGDVLSGPARAALPYYELVLREGAYGGARDTVFVKIGREVDRNWRLMDN